MSTWFHRGKILCAFRYSSLEKRYNDYLSKLSPTDRKRSENISIEIARRIPLSFGWTTGMAIASGWSGFFWGLFFSFLHVVVAPHTEGKLDTVVEAATFFSLSLFALYLFFGDIWKALSLPAAFLFYTLGKKRCPDYIKQYLGFYEKGVLGSTLTESETQQADGGVKHTDAKRKLPK